MARRGVACVAGAIKGKGEGKSGAREGEGKGSSLAPIARARFPFSLPIAPATQARRGLVEEDGGGVGQ